MAIIGGGPSGLMAAEILVEAGFKVDLYEAMPSVGRKFLMAGKGGLNISNSDSNDVFLSKIYGQSKLMKSVIDGFTPSDVREWLSGLGIETFVGSSGRIFPTDMKAAPLLRKWLHRLRAAGVNFHMYHKWLGWDETNTQQLIFNVKGERLEINVHAVVLALGGASWPKLGSTGEWVPILAMQNVLISPLRPSNCGFDAIWSDYFRNRYSGQPLKSVSVSVSRKKGKDIRHKGELIVTEYGLEGGVIYTLSAILRDEIAESGYVMIYLDLIPNIDKAMVINKISQDRGKQSMATHLRKKLGIDGVKAGLIRELVQASCFSNVEQLCTLIKSMPIKLVAARPIEEAISTAGGVELTALDNNLMIINKPSVFCAGEMLDWEAPTGGYLLTTCLSLGRAAGLGVIASLDLRIGDI